MIHTYVPYADKEHPMNLGWAYNNFMKLIGEDDWACFLDHDACFTTSTWYTQLEDAIAKNPEIGAFGCRTNRVANMYQLVGGIDTYNNDIEYQRKIGNEIKEKYKDSIFTVTENTLQNGFSGVFILISKKTWKKIGGFLEGQFLGVDNDLRHRLEAKNIPFAIIDGVYVYHWYRFSNPYPHSVPILAKIAEFNKTKNEIFLYRR